MQTLNGNSQSITSEMKVREYYPTRFCFMVKLENFKPNIIFPQKIEVKK